MNVYDGRRVLIIDVNTGNDIILPEYDIYSYSLDQIIWSSDGRYIIIDNEFSGYGADGSESILIADLREGVRFTEIFSMDENKVWYGQTTDLIFDESNKDIYFSERSSSGTIKYKYNIPSEELVIID